jgi:hypothetical protein
MENRSEMLRTDCESQIIEPEPQKAHKASKSKKGFGPLIGKERREWLKLPQNPGPGNYFKTKFE